MKDSACNCSARVILFDYVKNHYPDVTSIYLDTLIKELSKILEKPTSVITFRLSKCPWVFLRIYKRRTIKPFFSQWISINIFEPLELKYYKI